MLQCQTRLVHLFVQRVGLDRAPDQRRQRVSPLLLRIDVFEPYAPRAPHGVGNWFLSGCSGLTALGLTPITDLTSIGYGFLFGCSGLTALDLTPFARFTTMSSSFLSGCKRLTALDLTPLERLTSVGHSFLAGCYRLT